MMESMLGSLEGVDENDEYQRCVQTKKPMIEEGSCVDAYSREELGLAAPLARDQHTCTVVDRPPSSRLQLAGRVHFTVEGC